MATVYLGLGTNLGNKKHNLTQALELISQHAEIEDLSSIYETEPEGFTQQPHFLNAVCRITTELNPESLLDLIKKIEYDMGRKPGFSNAPRLIDIDILLYNDMIINSQKLTVPHPRLSQRAFVLIPLSEIAPELKNPENGVSISQLVKNLGSISGVNKWANANELNHRRQDV
jgi:2-amino-4-hydroxy-6-hydroxymethyldihydropteridine diphosphokinase